VLATVCRVAGLSGEFLALYSPWWARRLSPLLDTKAQLPSVTAKLKLHRRTLREAVACCHRQTKAEFARGVALLQQRDNIRFYGRYCRVDCSIGGEDYPMNQLVLETAVGHTLLLFLGFPATPATGPRRRDRTVWKGKKIK